MEEHIPVLLNEVIDGLNIKPSGIYLDLTVGRGGHSSEILARLKTGRLIAVDQDEEAIIASSERLSKISDHYKIIRANFSALSEILSSEGLEEVDGILMDLGVSSPQFDKGERGFSYNADARLDMRMDQNQTKTAKQIVNTYEQKQLALPTLTPEEEIIFENLNVEEKGVDELLSLTGLSFDNLLMNLTTMELKGIIKQVDGDRYKKV